MDLSEVTREQIEFVMDRLKNIPRKSWRNKSSNKLFLGLRRDFLKA
jgi:IS30 family transposase